MDKYLIINADDFGMCRAANLAVMDLLKSGSITSSTIMAPCPWAYEACQFAKKNPQFAIGVHLTFTSEWATYRWSPVGTSNTDSLRDELGFMHPESIDVEKNADIKEVAAEIHAQINRLKALGLTPSHLDNHMGSLYGIETGRFELLQLVLSIAGKYGLPFRFPGTFTDAQMSNTMLDIKIDKEQIMGLVGQLNAYAHSVGVVNPDFLLPGEWTGPQNDSYDNYRDYIYELYKTFPEGVTETYIHPALECDELKGITNSWHRRVWEYKLFSDPKTKQHIDSLGIKLINYRDLAEMKK